MLRHVLLPTVLALAACRAEPHPGVAQPALGTVADSERYTLSGGEATRPSQVTIGTIRWFTDYDTAVLFGRAQDKALWVHFGENPG